MKIEPSLSWQAPLPAEPPVGSRALVPVQTRLPPSTLAEIFDQRDEGSSPARERIETVDARNISPRQIAEISMDLYVSGALSWEEYALLAFQPELHPDYERTIGALTGEQAEPNRPRDFIAQWQKRLAFERKYNADKPDLVARSQRIVDVLRQLRARSAETD